jgi:hypothetical protein
LIAAHHVQKESGMRTVKVALALIALASVTVIVAKPRVDYDKSVDFSEYTTYVWQEGTPAPSDLVQERLERAVNGQLAAKNMKMTDSGADLYVVMHASVGSETQITSSSFGYGGYGGWRGWGGWGGGTTTVNVNEIPVGTVVIDLVDAKENKLVWRGIASGTVKSKPEKSEKQINKKIGKMFAKFPPPAEN